MPKVLLLEDDPDAGKTIQAMLEALGYSSVWVLNGLEALAFLENHPAPDLVLTDILMPGMDGLEAIQHFRKTFAHVPIVAMSGQVNLPHLQAAVIYGARATLNKPFSLAALKEALLKAIGP